MEHRHKLSKSKLLSFRQCPKRLWLEIHHPEWKQESSAMQGIFDTGHAVGAIAQRLYDPQSEGIVIDFMTVGVAQALRQTQEALAARKPVFEAGFVHGGVLAFADVLLPAADGGWRMIEVKSSTEVKPYQVEDVAVQSWIAKGCGLDLRSVSIAHVVSSWTYPGQGDYRGLLAEEDLGAQALALHDDVPRWIDDAQVVAAATQEPALAMGKHCCNPYDCPFAEHCAEALPKAEFPVTWLPRRSGALQKYIEEHRISDMRDAPDHLLNAVQKRVRHFTVRGEVFFDAEEAARALRAHPLPAYFLDFETIQHGVPRWAGTRPFQNIPFQFSLHKMDADGTLTHQPFLDLSGDDPSLAFTDALIAACPEDIPIFVYNAAFEKTRIDELARRFEHARDALLALKARVVDLLPIARQCYYHKEQHGSWSIKKVLPCMVPHLNYATLSGVQDGVLAMQAYAEGTHPGAIPERRAEIAQQLLDYCALDTLAMVEMWKFLSGAKAL